MQAARNGIVAGSGSLGMALLLSVFSVEQARRRHVQPARNLVQRLDPDIALATLDPADVVAVQPGALGQLLLAKFTLLAEVAHFAAEGN